MHGIIFPGAFYKYQQCNRERLIEIIDKEGRYILISEKDIDPLMDYFRACKKDQTKDMSVTLQDKKTFFCEDCKKMCRVEHKSKDYMCIDCYDKKLWACDSCNTKFKPAINRYGFNHLTFCLECLVAKTIIK